MQAKLVLNEINDTSIVANCGCPSVKISGVACLKFVLSMTVTRGSCLYFPSELIVSDIKCIAMCCTVLKCTICKTACRSTDIQNNFIFRHQHQKLQVPFLSFNPPRLTYFNVFPFTTNWCIC